MPTLLNYVDPATAYNLDFGMLTRPVYDGLVAYRATGGAAGVAIVPDLAVSAAQTDERGPNIYVHDPVWRPVLEWRRGPRE